MTYARILKHLRKQIQYRGVEQLEARRAHNPEVVGSSPASATKKPPRISRFRVVFLYFPNFFGFLDFCLLLENSTLIQQALKIRLFSRIHRL